MSLHPFSAGELTKIPNNSTPVTEKLLHTSGVEEIALKDGGEVTFYIDELQPLAQPTHTETRAPGGEPVTIDDRFLMHITYPNGISTALVVTDNKEEVDGETKEGTAYFLSTSYGAHGDLPLVHQLAVEAFEGDVGELTTSEAGWDLRIRVQSLPGKRPSITIAQSKLPYDYGDWIPPTIRTTKDPQTQDRSEIDPEGWDLSLVQHLSRYALWAQLQ